MNWSLQAYGKVVDNTDEEAGRISQFVRRVIEVAKELELGLTQVSVSGPDVTQPTAFSTSQNIDVTEETPVEEEEAAEDT